MKLGKRVFILALCLLLTGCAPAAETPESPARTEGPAAPADPAGVQALLTAAAGEGSVPELVPMLAAAGEGNWCVAGG